MKVTDILKESFDDYDRDDATRDDFLDGFNKWLDNVVASDFISVYRMIEDMDENSPVAKKLEQLVPDLEDSYVHKKEVKSFASEFRKSPEAAVKKYVEHIDDLRDSDDLRYAYADDKSYKKGPYRYHGVSPSDFA